MVEKQRNFVDKLKTDKMNIFQRLKNLFFGKNNSSNTSIYVDTDLFFQSEKTEIKEKTLEELYPNMSDDEIWNAISKKKYDEELTSVEEDFDLAMIFHSEHRYGRSLAIKELVNNHYHILHNEYGNPFKELINFTLKYFEGLIVDKQVGAYSVLKNAFPIMHQYIYRQIYKKQNIIEIENHFDEQKAYDEFLLFCKNFFCSLYPDKNKRDLQIRTHFEIMHEDLIRFIENENVD